jgi:hypothetical protein
MTTDTLQQVLDVLTYAKQNHEAGLKIKYAYRDAIGRVAQEYDVNYQTIGDGCRRRLQLSSMDEFGRLITKWIEGNPDPLQRVLKSAINKRFHYLVDDFFQSMEEQPEDSDSSEDHLSFTLQLGASEYRYLKILCELEECDQTELLQRLVSEGLHARMQQITEQLD